MYFTFQGYNPARAGMPFLSNQLMMRLTRKVTSLSVLALPTMLLAAFLLFATGANAGAAAYPHRVSLKGKDVSPKAVFAALKKQTGYKVFFENGEGRVKSCFFFNTHQMHFQGREIVEDVAVTAVYDFYGSNGMITIITNDTKKIKPEKSHLDLNLYLLLIESLNIIIALYSTIRLLIKRSAHQRGVDDTETDF